MEKIAQLQKMSVARLLPFLLIMLLSPAAAVPLASGQVASIPGARRLAPDFSRLDLSHRSIKLSSYRGKVVLLNFWATWCAPCLAEMPIFREWQNEYGPRKFQVIGVSMDDAVPEVLSTAAKLKLNYPVLMGSAKLGTAYGGVLGLPVTFLIDRDGEIRGRYLGEANLAHIKRDIESLLKN